LWACRNRARAARHRRRHQPADAGLSDGHRGPKEPGQFHRAASAKARGPTHGFRVFQGEPAIVEVPAPRPSSPRNPRIHDQPIP
jgi:hypothetical protein